MRVSSNRAFQLLREMAFERVSCSENEEKAANRLLEEARSIGAQAHMETFSVPCGRVRAAKLVVTAPYEREYEVTGYERSLSTPAGGLDADFYYAEDVLPGHLKRAEGKIVMINGRLRRKDFAKLQQAKAAAILTFSGTVLDRRGETDLDKRKLRETLTDAFGDAIALNLRAKDAAEIVRRGAKRMHIEVDSERYEGTSRNVCATIPGEAYPDQIISFGAHYDSVHFSTGVYDNMAGSVILMELLRYFMAHRPARTLQFNWYGSEEQGLLGSKAWTSAHESELGKHVLMINVDVAAPTLGHSIAHVLATDQAKQFTERLMEKAEAPILVKADIYSSDCVPFADHGVPAVNICRFGAPGADFIHDRRDSLKSGYIDSHALDITLRHTLYLAKHVVNRKRFPIAREIGDEMKDKIDKYLFRKEE